MTKTHFITGIYDEMIERLADVEGIEKLVENAKGHAADFYKANPDMARPIENASREEYDSVYMAVLFAWGYQDMEPETSEQAVKKQ
jgi:hypothetical protein